MNTVLKITMLRTRATFLIKKFQPILLKKIFAYTPKSLHIPYWITRFTKLQNKVMFLYKYNFIVFTEYNLRWK